MFDSKTLLRNCDANTPGVFILHKAKFLSAKVGEDQYDLCNNLTYTGVQVTEGTDYQNEEVFVNRKPDNSDEVFEVRSIVRYQKVIDASPDFIIVYIEFHSASPNKAMKDIQQETTPSLMWYGRSFFHLLKNMREWQYVYVNNIEPSHPMGIYSNIAIDKMNPSQELLEEIDGWPDMHLAKFFKGNEDYKLIPNDFPEPSEEMKQWVLSLASIYQEKTFSEFIDSI
jgi:hypothetical protein